MTSAGQNALIELAIEPKIGADSEKLRAALTKLAEQDASFDFACDQESGQFIIRGVSEEQLDEKITALKNTCNVEVNVGQPQVAYRETITCAADIDHAYTKITGPTCEFARIIFRVTPLERGAGFIFENSASDQTIPEACVGGAERGVNIIRGHGLLVGFPIIDFKIELCDGAFHDIDSSPLAFERAARRGLLENRERLGLILLEPIMKVEVTTPEKYVGNIVADLSGRQGIIQHQAMCGLAVVIKSLTPLRNMFGYMKTLRAMTEGRGSYSMEFSHYDRIPTINDDPPPMAAAGALRA